MILDEKYVRITALVLLAIGALNWGCAAMNCNLVTMCSKNKTFHKFVYGLVGIAGIIALYYIYKEASNEEYYMSPQYFDATSSVSADGEYVGIDAYNSFTI